MLLSVSFQQQEPLYSSIEVPSEKPLSNSIIVSLNQVNERLKLLLGLNERPNYCAVDDQALNSLLDHLVNLLGVIKTTGDVEEMNKKMKRVVCEVNFWRKHLREFKQLTPREKEVLGLLAQGQTNKEIADNLGISLETSKHYRKIIKSKLGVSSTADLVLYSQAFNLV